MRPCISGACVHSVYYLSRLALSHNFPALHTHYLQCSGPSTISVFILSTYTDGKPPEPAEWFCRWVQEAVDDFRVQKSLLAKVKFTVFALGHSLYDTNYCLAGKNLFVWLSRLSGRPVYPLGLGDQNVSQSVNGGNLIITI